MTTIQKERRVFSIAKSSWTAVLLIVAGGTARAQLDKERPIGMNGSPLPFYTAATKTAPYGRSTLGGEGNPSLNDPSPAAAAVPAKSETPGLAKGTFAGLAPEGQYGLGPTSKPSAGDASTGSSTVNATSAATSSETAPAVPAAPAQFSLTPGSPIPNGLCLGINGPFLLPGTCTIGGLTQIGTPVIMVPGGYFVVGPYSYNYALKPQPPFTFPLNAIYTMNGGWTGTMTIYVQVNPNYMPSAWATRTTDSMMSDPNPNIGLPLCGGFAPYVGMGYMPYTNGLSEPPSYQNALPGPNGWYYAGNYNYRSQPLPFTLDPIYPNIQAVTTVDGNVIYMQPAPSGAACKSIQPPSQ